MRTIGFWDAAQPQDWNIGWRSSCGVEIAFLEAGSISCSVDEKDYLLEPGSLVLVRPLQRYRIGTPFIGSGRLFRLVLDVESPSEELNWQWPNWLVLSQRDRADLASLLNANPRPVRQTTSFMRKYFSRIAELVVADDVASVVSPLTLALNELFLEMLIMLRKAEVGLDHSLQERNKLVRQFLDEFRGNASLLQREWSLDKLAFRCGLGPSQFSKYCKTFTNMTPNQFLNYERVQLASRLLSKEFDMSITNIAMACGFSSSQYFATVFRRFMGDTPREYRKRIVGTRQ